MLRRSSIFAMAATALLWSGASMAQAQIGTPEDLMNAVQKNSPKLFEILDNAVDELAANDRSDEAFEKFCSMWSDNQSSFKSEPLFITFENLDPSPMKTVEDFESALDAYFQESLKRPAIVLTRFIALNKANHIKTENLEEKRAQYFASLYYLCIYGTKVYDLHGKLASIEGDTLNEVLKQTNFGVTLGLFLTTLNMIDWRYNLPCSGM